MPVENLNPQALSIICTYLRAVDLVNLCLVKKTLFTKEIVEHAVYLIFQCSQDIINQLVNSKRLFFSQQMEKVYYTPKLCYLLEQSLCQLALNASVYTIDTIPANKSMYWISNTWLSSIKKQCNTILALPQNQLQLHNLVTTRTPSSSGKHKDTPKKHLSPKPKEIRTYHKPTTTSPLSPLPEVLNADIYCAQHNQLNVCKEYKMKKKLISSKYWKLLTRYAPVHMIRQLPPAISRTPTKVTKPSTTHSATLPSRQGIAYYPLTFITLPYTTYSIMECAGCLQEYETEKSTLLAQQEEEKTWRWMHYLPPSLLPLYQRKGGIPTHCRPSTTSHAAESSLPTTHGGEDHVVIPTAVLPRETIHPELLEVMDGEENALYDLEVDYWLARQLAAMEAEEATRRYLAHLEVGTSSTTPTHSSSLPSMIFPVASGIYHLVSRDWLRHWRRYVKDPTYGPLSSQHSSSSSTSSSSSSCCPLDMLDCSFLLCEQHGCLQLPAHVKQYLYGTQASLFGHNNTHTLRIPTRNHTNSHNQNTGNANNNRWRTLSSNGGSNGGNSNTGNRAFEEEERYVEIVTVEEWEALQDLMCHASSHLPAADPVTMIASFPVRFSIDNVARQIEWNVPVCHLCSPIVV